MTTYQVTAWCSVPYYTTFDVDADSVDDALEKARRQAREECGEPCGGGESAWNDFEIVSEGDADEYIRYLEPSHLAESAADELLQALKEVSLALKCYTHWQPSMAEHLAAVVETAINKAIKQ